MHHKHRELFSVNEWEWFLKLGASYSDPEQKKSFYETVIEKKLADKSYSIFTDFPKSHGLEICREILEMLKHGKSKESA